MTSDEDKRYFPRYYNVKPGFPGRVLNKDNLQPMPGEVTDVSRDGLGFLAEERLVPGADVLLELGGRRIDFRIVYCTSDLIHKDKYRCGLHIRGSKDNLVTMFKVNDCLAPDEEPSS